MLTQRKFVWLVALAATLRRAATEEQQPGQLTAGDIDDNLNFEAYLAYKATAAGQQEFADDSSALPNPDLSDRVPILVSDSNGAPFSCAVVEVQGGGEEPQRLPAGTNGRLSLFPSLDGLLPPSDAGAPWKVAARAPGGTCPEDCSDVAEVTPPDPDGGGGGGLPAVSLRIPATSSPPASLDLALAIDATSSMCDELTYLQSELGAVLTAVAGDRAAGDPDVRVGVVAYRDRGDEYVVRATPLSAPDEATAALAAVACGGGGDYPEAMEEAVEAAAALEWRGGNVARVLLLVADAPPHDQNLRRALAAALDLRRRGVRAYGLAASGVADTAEYLMRLMSLVTGARYMWLTDDSGIGGAHAEPKVLCYQVTKLDRLLIRVLSSELLGRRVEADPSEVIRETGKQEGGVCIVDVDPEPVTPSPTPSPDGEFVSEEGPDSVPGEGTDRGELFTGGGDVAVGSAAGARWNSRTCTFGILGLVVTSLFAAF